MSRCGVEALEATQRPNGERRDGVGQDEVGLHSTGLFLVLIRGGGGVAHAEAVGQISQRVAERRELPV